MKIYTLVAGLSALLLSCSPELELVSGDVPPAVVAAFQAKYPDAGDVEWEAEKHDGHLVFEAEFKQGNKEKEACFKPDGTFVEEE